MLVLSKLKKYEWKYYDKRGSLPFTLDELKAKRAGPKTCTDIYFWVIDGCKLEPTPAFVKRRVWWVPKIRIKPIFKINLWSKK